MDAASDRRNGNIFLLAGVLLYLSAPVRYVGVVQAALCDKLGASAVVANLPATSYFFACFAPIVCACLIPHRFEKTTVVSACWGIAVLSVLAACVLLVPMPGGVRIWVIVGQSLLLGLLNSVEQVFLLQCLGRGTTPAGRARALKLTFTVAPVAAVAGSLAGQAILRGAVPFLRFPQDFASLYLFGGLCSALTALACARLTLDPIPDEAAESFFGFLAGSVRRYLQVRDLAWLWLGYLLWYFTILALPNLSLYTRQAMGREPAEFSGLVMAIQFVAKAAAGYTLGSLYQRYGERMPLFVAIAAAGLSLAWAWAVPGYAYLVAFVFMGAAQLGGIYFPNVLLTWSSPATSTRDLAVLNLAVVAASPAPAVYGAATDRWGFPASFALGIAAAAASLGCVLLISAARGRRLAAEARSG
jgi:hypothetical protein